MKYAIKLFALTQYVVDLMATDFEVRGKETTGEKKMKLQYAELEGRTYTTKVRKNRVVHNGQLYITSTANGQLVLAEHENTRENKKTERWAEPEIIAILVKNSKKCYSEELVGSWLVPKGYVTYGNTK